MFESDQKTEQEGGAERRVNVAATSPHNLTELARRAASADQLKLVLELVSTVLSERRFADAARALVTAVSTRLGCDRVSAWLPRWAYRCAGAFPQCHI